MNSNISLWQTQLKRNVRLWIFFDFANSLGFIAVSFYFALWLVEEQKASDIWVSIPVALATLVLLFILPSLGSWSDRIQRKMPFFRFFTILSIVTLFVLGIVATKNGPLTGRGMILVAGLYFLFQFFYQSSLAFYNSFIHSVSLNSSKERISGLGMAAGQLGNILGLIIFFPIAAGKIDILGISGRGSTFLIGSILFFIFSLPVLLFLKDQGKNVLRAEKFKTANTLRDTWESFKRTKNYPDLRAYLVTYYLFADALLTLQLFVSLYLEKVAGIDDKGKTITLVVALIFGILGALISFWIARLLKSTQKAISTFIAIWAIIFSLLAFAENKFLFMALVVFNGFAYGVLFALSRAFYSSLIPEEHQAEFFGIYTLFERFASILGPLVWSGTIFLLATFNQETQYRFAMFSLGILIAISFFTFRLVKNPKEDYRA